MPSNSPTIDAVYGQLNERLDRIQESLPPVAARLMSAQRKMSCAAMTMAERNAERMKQAFEQITRSGDVATNTVVGQARAAADDVAKTTSTAVKTVVGQARAQAERVGAVAGDEISDVASDLADDIDTVAGAASRGAAAAAKVMEREVVDGEGSSPDHGYETWTRDELYTRAKELDVTGRSSMTKDELIAALRDES